MSFTYEYARPALAVDCVVFGLDENDLKVLLIQRKLAPFQHAWALPGGFVRVGETLDEAAQRELREEAGVDDVYLEQLYTFGALGRDPRERVVTVAYYALAKLSDHRIRAATDAMGVGWFALDDLPKLAFDHEPIVARGDETVAIANRLLPYFSTVVATQDWHPADHESFAQQHRGRKPGDMIELHGLPQVLWPPHCVQGTRGADLHPDLQRDKITEVF